MYTTLGIGYQRFFSLARESIAYQEEYQKTDDEDDGDDDVVKQTIRTWDSNDGNHRPCFQYR